MSYLELRGWKKTIQSDKKMLKFVEEKHVGQIRKGRVEKKKVTNENVLRALSPILLFTPNNRRPRLGSTSMPAERSQ